MPGDEGFEISLERLSEMYNKDEASRTSPYDDDTPRSVRSLGDHVIIDPVASNE